jgi:GMP synthase (glutamine-hydrolysing)
MNAFKPFLLLQVRPEDEAADNEYEAFCTFGNLDLSEVHRVRLDQESLPDIDLEDYSGVFLGGGPFNVSDDASKKSEAQVRAEKELQGLFQDIIEGDIPYLGDCYGLGMLSTCVGGTVSKEKYSESVGVIHVHTTDAATEDDLMRDLPPSFHALGGHKEACQGVPDGAVLLASSDECPVQMLRVKNNMYATQFHVELDVPGILLRIDIYKHAGYFPPEDAQKLKDAVKDVNVSIPMVILSRFVEKYKQPLLPTPTPPTNGSA